MSTPSGSTATKRIRGCGGIEIRKPQSAMPSRRAQKTAEAIREVVSMAILADLRDPRVRDVTVTYVEVSGDLRHAKVHVSVMGTETKQELSVRGLQNAAGFLQSKIANRVEMRYTPRLSFVLDQGVKRSIEISRILKQVLPEQDPSPADETAAEAEADAGELQSGETQSVKMEPGAARAPEPPPQGETAHGDPWPNPP
jgi:ribosome-binding factor A